MITGLYVATYFLSIICYHLFYFTQIDLWIRPTSRLPDPRVGQLRKIWEGAISCGENGAKISSISHSNSPMLVGKLRERSWRVCLHLDAAGFLLGELIKDYGFSLWNKVVHFTVSTNLCQAFNGFFVLHCRWRKVRVLQKFKVRMTRSVEFDVY